MGATLILRKPAGTLGEVHPVRNIEGVWTGGAAKMQSFVLDGFAPMGWWRTAICNDFWPADAEKGGFCSVLSIFLNVGWRRSLRKHCYMRCFLPAAGEKGDLYSDF